MKKDTNWTTKGTNLHEVLVCIGELGGFFVEPQMAADRKGNGRDQSVSQKNKIILKRG